MSTCTGGWKDFAKVETKVGVVDEVGGMEEGGRWGWRLRGARSTAEFGGGPGRVKGLEKGRLQQSAG